MVDATKKRFGRFGLFGTLTMAAALAVLIYMVLLALPYVAVGPTDDPHFGPLNTCLRKGLTQPSLGFAVSNDGLSAASYSANHVVACHSKTRTPKILSLANVTSAAFDAQNNLWLGTSPKEGQTKNLWKWPLDADSAVALHEAIPLSMAAHPRGMVVLESSGLLTSFDFEGKVLSDAQVAGHWPTEAHFAANSDGTLVAVMAHQSLITFRSEVLSPVSAASPCKASFFWWTAAPSKLRVECGVENVVLEFDVNSGQFETLKPSKKPTRATYVSGLRQSVQACENLPCVAPDTKAAQ